MWGFALKQQQVGCASTGAAREAKLIPGERGWGFWGSECLRAEAWLKLGHHQCTGFGWDLLDKMTLETESTVLQLVNAHLSSH